MSIVHARPQPFVGVCGVQGTADYAGLVVLAEEFLPGSGRFIMAGVKDSRVYIKPAVLSHSVRTFIHCDFSQDQLPEQFEQAVERTLWQTKHFVRGLQLNVLPWMEYDFAPVWRSIKQRYPRTQLILQVHKAILDRYTPAEIAERLRNLAIDYVLLDESQSRGLPFDRELFATYIAAISQVKPSLGIVAAGGLSGDLVEKQVLPLLGQYPFLSCDAFLRLCNPATGRLDWPSVERYLRRWQAAIRAIRRAPQKLQTSGIIS